MTDRGRHGCEGRARGAPAACPAVSTSRAAGRPRAGGHTDPLVPVMTGWLCPPSPPPPHVLTGMAANAGERGTGQPPPPVHFRKSHVSQRTPALR